MELPKPRTWALAMLAEKLKVGPPLLSELINLCTKIETVEEFLELIRTFLPEHETEILAERRMQRIYRFSYLFGKRYFPLPPFIHECSLEEFVGALPVTLMGMSHSVYHEPGDLRPGYALLLSLVCYPFRGDDLDMDDDEDAWPSLEGRDIGPEEMRLPLLDLVEKMVGTVLAQSIPRNGWTPEQLHQMTDSTVYKGMGNFADWVCGTTACIVLDANYGDCDYQEGYGEPLFKWTQRNVNLLTEEWPRVVETRQAIDHIIEWVEADPVNKFGQLLNYLLVQKPEAGTPPEYYWEEHVCPLDQRDEEADDD